MPRPGSNVVADGRTAAVAGVLAATMPETAVIERLTLVSDGAGGQDEDWVAVDQDPDILVDGNLPARLSPAGSTPVERAIAEREDVEEAFVVALPAGADITFQDRITVAGRTFDVVARLETSYEAEVRVVVTP